MPSAYSEDSRQSSEHALGLWSFVLRWEKTGYRYASVTLAIVVLIPRADAPWIVAWHRFIEITVGILVALAVVAFWREEQRMVLTARLRYEGAVGSRWDEIHSRTCRLRRRESAEQPRQGSATCLTEQSFTHLSMQQALSPG
jgi:uncharacterized membrane protein YgaE (UPF0421/DUF939 family)